MRVCKFQRQRVTLQVEFTMGSNALKYDKLRIAARHFSSVMLPLHYFPIAARHDRGFSASSGQIDAGRANGILLAYLNSRPLWI